MPPEDVVVPFTGPFSWPDTPDAQSVFDAEVRQLPGIYLWTVAQRDGHLVYYVGETGRSFEVRLLEHYNEHAACMYHVYSPMEFARGEKVALWPGRYDRADRKSPTECISQYARLSAPIKELTYLYRFFLAPLSCETRVRRRIEAAIACALDAAPGVAGTFQDRGIHYDPRTENEEPIDCAITSPVPVIGLPRRLSA
jgi:hypothetical protein